MPRVLLHQTSSQIFDPPKHKVDFSSRHASPAWYYIQGSLGLWVFAEGLSRDSFISTKLAELLPGTSYCTEVQSYSICGFTNPEIRSLGVKTGKEEIWMVLEYACFGTWNFSPNHVRSVILRNAVIFVALRIVPMYFIFRTTD
jgi:hypothetical protein